MVDISGIRTPIVDIPKNISSASQVQARSETPENVGAMNSEYGEFVEQQSGKKSAAAIAFNLSSASSKSVDLSKLMFQMRLMLRDAQAAEAEMVIAELNANAQALMDKGATIREKAKEAKDKADAAAWMTIATGILSIGLSAVNLGSMGKSTKAGMDNMLNATRAQMHNAMISAGAQAMGGGAELLKNDAEYIRQDSAAIQAEQDAIANKAQAEKQRAELQENFYKDMLASLKKIADELLQEQTQVLRNVARNI